MAAGTLAVWRHPKPEGAAGLCVGARCNLAVQRRRAKRLARRIQAHARRHRLAHVVWTSPLQRCADVGAWLKRWGWTHHRHAALAELDFGAWDGQPWAQIPQAEVDAWVADFAGFAPEGGECLADLLQRAAGWRPAAEHGTAPGTTPGTALVVSHGGWMLARRWAVERGWTGPPQARPADLPRADQWPRPPRYGEGWTL